MGLDNIPREYACARAGTAIMTADERQIIDCEATINAGQCPWKVAAERRGTPVLGIFGTPCWYRGKAGTSMLDTLAGAGHPLPPDLAEGFYGPDQQTLPPEYCVALAAFMEDHAEAYAAAVGSNPEAIEQYRYAAWWLRFAAESCGGANAWW